MVDNFEEKNNLFEIILESNYKIFKKVLVNERDKYRMKIIIKYSRLRYKKNYDLLRLDLCYHFYFLRKFDDALEYYRIKEYLKIFN